AAFSKRVQCKMNPRPKGKPRNIKVLRGTRRHKKTIKSPVWN
ncbi:MAG: hypothetical protein JWL71_5175, partial [Acidobacteria bacterium]|nr:hypothetical protein [Acidobacteriota bacterium]